jgi:hypothetical protein
LLDHQEALAVGPCHQHPTCRSLRTIRAACLKQASWGSRSDGIIWRMRANARRPEGLRLPTNHYHHPPSTNLTTTHQPE